MTINQILGSGNLHDSILRKITYEWESRELVLDIAGKSCHSPITIRDVASLTFSSTFPWGSSNQINGVKSTRHEAFYSYEIEMQSGDCISIKCGPTDF